ncbi:MAG: hypothetical protein HY002_08465 [Candidatus Rokubacteria bacterium]|nr:hypothetical protein [Candidatus Rokubacteria bacterium]
MLAIFGLSSLLLLTWAVPSATAAGPWRGQIVDAETKAPLEGVVVLAVWWKATRSFGGPSEEYHASEEVLTDQDGRFSIAALTFWSLNPLVHFKGPEFLFFRPGYGRAWPEDKSRAVGTYAKLLQGDGIVLGMPVLRTLEERKEYLKDVRSAFETVPLERTPLLKKAITDERRAVGYGG